MIYMRTRSTKEDYDFIGEKPKDSWWSAEYGRFLQEGNFNVFVEIDSSKWRIFAGGIPSKRTDYQTRPLRYDFAGEGQCNDPGARFFYRLFAYLLYADKNCKALSTVLDTNLFSQTYIDGIDRDRHSEKTCQEIKNKLEKLYSFLEEEMSSQGILKKQWPPLTKNGVYQKNDSTCGLFISTLSALTDPAKGPASLIITSLPIDKQGANHMIQKIGGPFLNGKLLWLTEYDQNDADYDTGIIFPLEFPVSNHGQENDNPSSGGNIMKTTQTLLLGFTGGIIGGLLTIGGIFMYSNLTGYMQKPDLTGYVQKSDLAGYVQDVKEIKDRLLSEPSGVERPNTAEANSPKQPKR